MKNVRDILLIVGTVVLIAFLAIVANHKQGAAATNGQQQQPALLADIATTHATSSVSSSSPATIAAIPPSVVIPPAPALTSAPASASTTITATATTEKIIPPPSVASATTTAKPVPASAPAAPTPTRVALPYSVGTFGNTFQKGDGWANWWGDTSQSGGVLTIGATASSTGGAAVLAGSSAWSDYTFQANIDWIKGETFGLVARYVNPKNYLLCEFDEPSPGTVHMSIKKYVNGAVTTMVTGDVPNYEQMGGLGIVAAFAVKGNEAVCSFNAHQVVTFFLGVSPAAPQKGGIGIAAQDPRTNNSRIVVHSVGVVSGLYNIGSTGQ